MATLGMMYSDRGGLVWRSDDGVLCEDRVSTPPYGVCITYCVCLPRNKRFTYLLTYMLHVYGTFTSYLTLHIGLTPHMK